MDVFLTAFPGVGVAILTGLMAAIVWFVKAERTALFERLDHLASHIDELMEELTQQRRELHNAILAHEARIATLEGALRYGRRTSDRGEA